MTNNSSVLFLSNFGEKRKNYDYYEKSELVETSYENCWNWWKIIFIIISKMKSILTWDRKILSSIECLWCAYLIEIFKCSLDIDLFLTVTMKSQMVISWSNMKIPMPWKSSKIQKCHQIFLICGVFPYQGHGYHVSVDNYSNLLSIMSILGRLFVYIT